METSLASGTGGQQSPWWQRGPASVGRVRKVCHHTGRSRIQNCIWNKISTVETHSCTRLSMRA